MTRRLETVSRFFLLMLIAAMAVLSTATVTHASAIPVPQNNIQLQKEHTCEVWNVESGERYSAHYNSELEAAKLLQTLKNLGAKEFRVFDENATMASMLLNADVSGVKVDQVSALDEDTLNVANGRYVLQVKVAGKAETTQEQPKVAKKNKTPQIIGGAAVGGIIGAVVDKNNRGRGGLIGGIIGALIGSGIK